MKIKKKKHSEKKKNVFIIILFVSIVVAKHFHFDSQIKAYSHNVLLFGACRSKRIIFQLFV